MVVANQDHLLTLTGNGDVLESDDGVVGAHLQYRRCQRTPLPACLLLTRARVRAHLSPLPPVGIGSGGPFAACAARALMTVDGLTAEEIARRAMKIAAVTCVYTNGRFTAKVLEAQDQSSTVSAVSAATTPGPSEDAAAVAAATTTTSAHVAGARRGGGDAGVAVHGDDGGGAR